MTGFDIPRAIEMLLSGQNDQIDAFAAQQRTLREEAENRKQEEEI